MTAARYTDLTADGVDVDGFSEVFFDRGAGQVVLRRADGDPLALEGGDDDWASGDDIRHCSCCGRPLFEPPERLAAGHGRPRGWWHGVIRRRGSQ